MLVFTIFLLLISGCAFCQQYDLYVYDVRAKTARAVSQLAGANVYNATWNNNSKKLAHDVVGGPAWPYDQSIYITDVATGTSALLQGAEGGNDPAWSPNGQTIAFDAWDFNPYNFFWTRNIYTVDAGGGMRKLVRYNAGHASWAPNGQQLAFADDWGGYIGTINTDRTGEKFVAYGNWPSWSPNGQYIAYNGWGGGVWVIEVDATGAPVGSPRQLTTSGYGPTWSNNSKELVYIDWPDGNPDLYSISLSGGTPTQVYGQPGGFDRGDYDPAYSNNGEYIAYSGFTLPSWLQPSSSMLSKATAKKEASGPKGLQLYPNPFREQSTLSFEVTTNTNVHMQVYNASGQLVRTLTQVNLPAGRHTLVWNGQDDSGKPLPNGLYFIRLQNGSSVQTATVNKLR